MRLGEQRGNVRDFGEDANSFAPDHTSSSRVLSDLTGFVRFELYLRRDDTTAIGKLFAAQRSLPLTAQDLDPFACSDSCHYTELQSRRPSLEETLEIPPSPSTTRAAMCFADFGAPAPVGPWTFVEFALPSAGHAVKNC